MLAWLSGVRERMDRMGCEPRDQPRVALEAAWEKTHSLSVTLHYLRCPEQPGSSEPRRQESS